MTSIVGPIAVPPGLPGGIRAAYDVAATGVIKSSPGILVRLVASTSGTLTLSDTNALVSAQTVTGITAAANAVVTLSTGGTTNPFAVGNPIILSSVAGMTQINGLLGTVTAVGGVTTAWTVTTSINSSAFTAYSSGGTAASTGIQNEITAFASFTVGTPIELEWPCAFGIAVSAVSGAVVSIAFT